MKKKLPFIFCVCVLFTFLSSVCWAGAETLIELAIQSDVKNVKEFQEKIVSFSGANLWVLLGCCFIAVHLLSFATEMGRHFGGASGGGNIGGLAYGAMGAVAGGMFAVGARGARSFLAKRKHDKDYKDTQSVEGYQDSSRGSSSSGGFSPTGGDGGLKDDGATTSQDSSQASPRSQETNPAFSQPISAEEQSAQSDEDMINEANSIQDYDRRTNPAYQIYDSQNTHADFSSSFDSSQITDTNTVLPPSGIPVFPSGEAGGDGDDKPLQKDSDAGKNSSKAFSGDGLGAVFGDSAPSAVLDPTRKRLMQNTMAFEVKNISSFISNAFAGLNTGKENPYLTGLDKEAIGDVSLQFQDMQNALSTDPQIQSKSPLKLRNNLTEKDTSEAMKILTSKDFQNLENWRGLSKLQANKKMERLLKILFEKR